MADDRVDIEKLAAYTHDSMDNEEDFHFMRFESIQRLNIAHLQIDLTRMKSRLISGQVYVWASDLEDLRLKLQQYTVAVRDYQYLQDKRILLPWEARGRKLRLPKYFYSASELEDPWESHYSFLQDECGHSSTTPADYLREILMKHTPSRLTLSHQERLARMKEIEDGVPPKTVSKFVDRLAHLIAASAGSVFLIIPMIIMTLHPSQTKSLVTVSVAVVVFALMLSFGIQVSNIETLDSTATYAAVLVFFVGTSSGGSGG